MATRPVFISSETGDTLVRIKAIDFRWHAGMAKLQKQKSIRSLHGAIRTVLPESRILEVSSASEDLLGEKLSAFNLTFQTRGSGQKIAVECAFQGAKVFENGGPYSDLMSAHPRDAKRDPRLRESGRLLGFRFSGQNWALEPLTAFYDWIYINALHLQEELAADVMVYDSFTDIAFNPEKSINCQAGSVALYVSLRRRNLLDQALMSRENYLSIIFGINGKGVRREEGAPELLI